MISRFKRDLNGEFGDFFQVCAENKLQKTKDDLTSGEITIDEHGVARNCIGRVVMSDLAEVIELISDKFNKEATDAARTLEIEEFKKKYRKQQENQEISMEEMSEMRNAFGKGTTVVDVLSGRKMVV